MPVVELASASLQDGGYTEFSERRTAPGLAFGGSSSDYSSTKGRLGLNTDYRTTAGTSHLHDEHTIKTTSSTSTSKSIVKSAFTNFTESLSHSSEEFQDGVQKTFSSIVSSFSRDGATHSSSDSGYDDSGSSKWSGDSCSSSSSRSGMADGHHWSGLVLPEGLRTRVSSMTSRSSSYQTHTTNSTLSSRSTAPGSKSENISITVDSSGLVLRESSAESSTGSVDASSEASWQETASRDVSLLDTIGESGDEEDDGSSSSSSSSGSDSGSEVEDEEREEIELGGADGRILYDYDDDSTEFNSDVGLEDFGAAMLQIGSCHFEPESGSLSYEDDDYSYTSEMFPPVIANFIGQTKENEGKNGSNTGHHSQAGRNAVFQKSLNNNSKNRQRPGQVKRETGISTFFNKAFSCGAQI